uniref:CCR4-NOT transcription complex, subunit 2 n=2 Tax=Euarchontoglires TaxID=314146 RepID=E9Q8R6_MOUSE
MVRTDGHTLSEKRNYQPPALSFPIPRVANVERSCTGDKQHVWCFKKEVCRGGGQRLP